MFKPKFTITSKVNSRIAIIEKYKTLVDQATILPELELQLRFRATVESVHSSTSIEGNPLNEQQVENILQGNVISAPDYAIQEVLNYKKALDWLNKNSFKFPLTLKRILEIHKILMTGLLPENKVGVLRPGPVYIVDEVDGKEIVQYTGPYAEDLSNLVESFLKWLSIQSQQKQYHPVLLAALIHYIFVSIHPFSDGNGRATRIMTTHYLRSINYDFRQSIALDSFYLQHRNEYYQALSRGNTFDTRMNADITEFIDFFVQGFEASANSISHYIQVGKVAEESGKTLRLSHEELQILDYIYEFGTINVMEAEDILSSSKRTTQRRLISLVKNNILRIEGKGPATKYMLAKSKS